MQKISERYESTISIREKRSIDNPSIDQKCSLNFSKIELERGNELTRRSPVAPTSSETPFFLNLKKLSKKGRRLLIKNRPKID